MVDTSFSHCLLNLLG